MNLRHALCAISLPTLLVSLPALANNITISGEFQAGGPQMIASPVSCASVSSQAYLEAGTIGVSFTGIYELADAGNLLGFTATGQGIVDVVISIYEDSFDPSDPSFNRIATVDEGDALALEAGRSYVLVIQPFCEDAAGVFGIVIRGPGTVSGAGFESPPITHGLHEETDNMANFPMGIGKHSYDASQPVQVAKSGLYYFADIGINFNAGITLLAYEESFNPALPSVNLAGSVSFAGSLNLSANKSYVFVAVDQDDLGGEWQYALFPPGEPRFNASMKGAWVTPGVDGAGVMMEVATNTGLIFFAWFTFAGPPAVLNADHGARPEAVGSSDQRWLTGFGAIQADSSRVNISYENTTGGIFNAETPKPTTDSSYGSGTAQIIDCSNIVLDFNLPDGVTGSAAMVRAIPDGLQDCLESIDAAPLAQNP